MQYWLGEFGQRKSEIGKFFKNISHDFQLNIDIETSEAKRIYGKKWYGFLESCKATLGVEGGSGLIDTDGIIQKECDQYISDHPSASFQEVQEKILYKYQQRTIYTAISPRVFEAAILKTCQILTRGDYSGVIKPDIHYIPINLDFSDYKETIEKFKDTIFRNQIIENAFNDICISDKWKYATFVKDFDKHLDEVICRSQNCS